MRDCIFCKIAREEIPCYKIWEDEKFLVFLDAFPSIKGQVLIVPKRHLEMSVFDLKDDFYTKIFLLAKKVAIAMQKALSPIKVGMIIEGLEIDHIHLKLYPLGEKGLVLRPMKSPPRGEEMKKIAKIISKNLNFLKSKV